MQSQKRLLDRAAGSLLGVAAGDALGAPYEGGSPPPGPVEMAGGGPVGYQPGEWTDDTTMALAIAEVAATGADLRDTQALAAIAERFLTWYRTDPSRMGITTRSVLSTASQPADLAAIARAYYERTGEAASNGALMRTAPVALAHLGDDLALVQAATAVAALTHANPLAGESCAIWCIAIDRAVREDRIDGAWNALPLLPPTSRDRWERWLAQTLNQPPATFDANGFTVTCLQAALSAVLQSPTPYEAYQTAVRIGHDTDTVAAVAGSLIGARCGRSAIPSDWQCLLHDRHGRNTEDVIHHGHAIITARIGTQLTR